jgi:hypothetical protein
MGTEGKKERKAPLWPVVTVIVLILMLGLCQEHEKAGFMEMSGTVLDAKTGQPVEGARVAIVWSTHTGPDSSEFGGKRVTDTDAAGHFVIEDAPKWQNDVYFAIYKQGYICWKPNVIFNGSAAAIANYTSSEYRDMGHQWRPGHQTYRLEPWVEGYSHFEHYEFINKASNRSGVFVDLLDMEREQAARENRERWERQRRGQQ